MDPPMRRPRSSSAITWPSPERSSRSTRRTRASPPPATGELVAFIDSDDLWHPRKLELQVAAFRAAGDVAFVYSGYDVIDSEGRLLETVRPDPRFQGDVYEKLWTEQNRILGPTIQIG